MCASLYVSFEDIRIIPTNYCIQSLRLVTASQLWPVSARRSLPAGQCLPVSARQSMPAGQCPPVSGWSVTAAAAGGQRRVRLVDDHVVVVVVVGQQLGYHSLADGAVAQVGEQQLAVVRSPADPRQLQADDAPQGLHQVGAFCNDEHTTRVNRSERATAAGTRPAVNRSERATAASTRPV